MFGVYIAITVLTVIANVYAATVDFMRAEWVVDNMTKYGVPHSWLPALGVAKTAGAVGLLAGIVIPPLGIAAAAGLALYFLGAVVTVVRARWPSHIPFPSTYLALAVGSLVLRVAVV